MRILIDECVPKIVKKRLSHFDIETVQEIGWSGVKNGELIKLAEADFDVFVTSDKNLQYQQNLKNRKMAFLILPSNQVPIIEKLLPEIEEVLTNIKSDDFIEISLP